MERCLGHWSWSKNNIVFDWIFKGLYNAYFGRYATLFYFGLPRVLHITILQLEIKTKVTNFKLPISLKQSRKLLMFAS
jgi:hypothetical protein